jgi:hypothetical protein
VGSITQIGGREKADALVRAQDTQPFFSIADLAERWRVSRSAVYGYLRGYLVLDFAPAPGRKGHKLVPADTVLEIERERMRILR